MTDDWLAEVQGRVPHRPKRRWWAVAARPLTNTQPLDMFPGASFGYSFRNLRSGYSGPAVQVLRASDSTLHNVSFLGADFNVPDYQAFIGGSTGTLQAWYDQSTYFNNQSQATAANQPGVKILNYPTTSISGATASAASIFMTDGDVASNQDMWANGGFLAIVYEVASGGTGTIFSKGASVGGWYAFSYLNGSTYQFLLYLKGSGGDAYTWISNAVSISPVRHVITIAFNSATPGTPATITLDGVTCGLNNTANFPVLTDVGKGASEVFNDIVGASNSEALNGTIYEIMGWKSQPSASVQTSLINNMRSYYGTP